jgi:hypothetical protein
VLLPYIIAMAEAAVFTVAGAIVTLTSVFASSWRARLAFAWRMWLWGTIGFIVGNVALMAALSPFLIGIGISGGAPRSFSLRDFVLDQLVTFGPLLMTTVGILLGCWYGWRRARRLGNWASNNRWRGP